MGFGNRLFPWARCRTFAQANTAAMISPVWIRPAIGQLFRGGIDYRSYLRQLVLLGLFHDRQGDLSLIRGLVRTRGLQVLNETECLQRFDSPSSLKGDALVIFRGLGRYFSPLQGRSEFLRNELVAITRPRYLANCARYPEVPIGLCIRCGNDFDPSPTDREILKPGEKTPISWFVHGLRLIRQAAGFPAAAFIVSDGTPNQLQDLLALENVHLVRPGSAISDLLIISRSRVLLASGSSSFAAWAAFFGQMPTASHRGQPMNKEWQLTAECGQFLAEFDPQDPSTDFLMQARQTLAESPAVARVDS